MKSSPRPTVEDVRAAARVIDGAARVSPAFRSETFTRRSGRSVVLKAENLQRTGSFKVRGALNRIAALSERERRAGVVAASAGNHGQAVAWAAREAGVAAMVFMPEEAALAKVEATKGYGADVRQIGAVLEDALEAALTHASETGAVLVHPFDDPLVVAGQGTIGLELAEHLDELTTVVVPVGGGGLASGIALVLAELRPDVRVLGVQSARCAPLAGETEVGFTIADGIAVKQPGTLTRPILDELLAGVVTVTDEQMALAIVLLLERAKLVVEGAGAASVAALLAGVVPEEGPVCCLLSGGNIDATVLIQVARHGLTQAGRYLVVRTRVPDRPGQLAALLTRLASEEGANVVEVQHHREGVDIGVWETELELTLLTRDEEHCAALLADMGSWGYPVVRVR
jgi:threonine dehydratase